MGRGGELRGHAEGIDGLRERLMQVKIAQGSGAWGSYGSAHKRCIISLCLSIGTLPPRKAQSSHPSHFVPIASCRQAREYTNVLYNYFPSPPPTKVKLAMEGEGRAEGKGEGEEGRGEEGAARRAINNMA